MAIYNKRAKFTIEQLLDHYLKRNSITDILYTIIRVIVIVVQNLYCISSYLVLTWLVLLPVNWIKGDLYSKLENYLYNSLSFIVSSWSLAAEITVIESGDEFKHLIEDPNKHCQEPFSENEKGRERQNDFAGRTSIDKRCLDDIPSKIHRQNGYAVNGKSDMNTVRKAIIKEQASIDSTSEQSESIENNNDLDDDHDLNITAETCGSVNNKNISEKVHITVIKNSQNCNDIAKSRGEPRILFLCNHISTADVPLIMQSFSTLTNHSMLWVLDAQFKFTNFGVVCGTHGDFFVSQNSFIDGSLTEHALRYSDRNLLVLFPEGGFLRKRIEGSNRYAVRNSLPQTKYVTHPRFGAFKDLTDPSVGVTHIVDATLMYDDIKNPLSVLDILFGNKKEPAILHYKLYKRSQINPTEEWLRNIWLEKDKMLQTYYEKRTSFFVGFKDNLRVARLDWFKILSVHLFFLLVSYLTIFRLFNATSMTMLKARELYYSNI